VFWQFFETLRESGLRESSLAGYPVARAEEIQNNPLVRTCRLECSCDGVLVRTIPLSSQPAIAITENAWREAARKLSSREEVPAPISFALDAAFCGERSHPNHHHGVRCLGDGASFLPGERRIQA
jgi:hypothetical protein